MNNAVINGPAEVNGHSHPHYWVIWGVRGNLGLWASRETRSEAEELRRFWKAQDPEMSITTHRVDEKPDLTFAL